MDLVKNKHILVVKQAGSLKLSARLHQMNLQIFFITLKPEIHDFRGYKYTYFFNVYFGQTTAGCGLK